MSKSTIAQEDRLVNRVLCMLTDSEYERLEAVCKVNYRSKSFVMREALVRYLESHAEESQAQA
jgi:predicted DNA-binding protein